MKQGKVSAFLGSVRAACRGPLPSRNDPTGQTVPCGVTYPHFGSGSGRELVTKFANDLDADLFVAAKENGRAVHDCVTTADAVADVCNEILSDGLSVSRRRRLRAAIDQYTVARNA